MLRGSKHSQRWLLPVGRCLRGFAVELCAGCRRASRDFVTRRGTTSVSGHNLGQGPRAVRVRFAIDAQRVELGQPEVGQRGALLAMDVLA